MAASALLIAALASCSDSENNAENQEEEEVIDPTIAEQFYAGGELGTSFISSSKAYEQPTPAGCHGVDFAIFFGSDEHPFRANHFEGVVGQFFGGNCLEISHGFLFFVEYNLFQVNKTTQPGRASALGAECRQFD